MLRSVQSHIVCRGRRKRKKVQRWPYVSGSFFEAGEEKKQAGQAPNDHNLSSCLFNYPPRPDWVSQSSPAPRMEWRRWNKNRPIPWEGCPLNPAANAAPAAPAGHYCCCRGGGRWHSKTRPPPLKSWSTGHVRRALVESFSMTPAPKHLQHRHLLNISIWSGKTRGANGCLLFQRFVTGSRACRLAKMASPFSVWGRPSRSSQGTAMAPGPCHSCGPSVTLIYRIWL